MSTNTLYEQLLRVVKDPAATDGEKQAAERVLRNIRAERLEAFLTEVKARARHASK